MVSRLCMQFFAIIGQGVPEIQGVTDRQTQDEDLLYRCNFGHFLEKIRLLPQCGVQGSAWKMGSCACWNTYYWPHFPTTQRVVKASSCQEHFQIRPYFAQLAGMIAQSNATLRAKRSKKKRKSERPALTQP